MLEAKRVVIYGLVNSRSDHGDYAILGEWVFDLYDRPIFSTAEPPAFKVQYRTARGRFAAGPTHRDRSGRYRYASGRFAAGPTHEIHVPVPAREKATGRYGAKPIRLAATPIPDDDQIVADTLRIIEDETGHGMYRTPSQREAGQDRVSIGIQHLDDSALKRTYNYDEYLREIRHRTHNEWSNR